MAHEFGADIDPRLAPGSIGRSTTREHHYEGRFEYFRREGALIRDTRLGESPGLAAGGAEQLPAGGSVPAAGGLPARRRGARLRPSRPARRRRGSVLPSGVRFDFAEFDLRAARFAEKLGDKQAALAHYRAPLARQPTRSDVAAAIARLESTP